MELAGNIREVLKAYACIYLECAGTPIESWFQGNKARDSIPATRVKGCKAIFKKYLEIKQQQQQQQQQRTRTSHAQSLCSRTEGVSVALLQIYHPRSHPCSYRLNSDSAPASVSPFNFTSSQHQLQLELQNQIFSRNPTFSQAPKKTPLKNDYNLTFVVLRVNLIPSQLRQFLVSFKSSSGQRSHR